MVLNYNVKCYACFICVKNGKIHDDPVIPAFGYVQNAETGLY